MFWQYAKNPYGKQLLVANALYWWYFRFGVGTQDGVKESMDQKWTAIEVCVHSQKKGVQVRGFLSHMLRVHSNNQR